MNNTKANILLVDDTPANLRLLIGLLKDQGYKVRPATTGKLALTAVESEVVDLILLDIMMPDMDGYEVCRRFKAQESTRDIPIIFLSALDGTFDKVKAFGAGGIDYISKPFQAEEVLARVETQLKLRQSLISLQLLNKELREKNDNINELLRIVCHDLTNPIAGMDSILDLLESNPSIYNKMEPYLKRSTKICLNIIDSVREIKSIEDGKMAITLERLELFSAIDDSLFLFQNKLNEKNLILKVDIPQEISVYVDVTPFINSVFNNILSNAIKFSNKNSTIEISAREESGIVKLSIKDYGIGIPESLLKDIFSVTKPTTRKGTMGEFGTGYGMPLVKKIIDRLEGKIEIHSVDGSGTEVILILKSGDLK